MCPQGLHLRRFGSQVRQNEWRSSIKLPVSIWGVHFDPSSHAPVYSTARKSREAEQCVRDIVKQCYKNPLIKQYFSLMMRGPSSLQKKSCNKQGIRQVIKHYPCLTASKPALDKCTKEAIRDTVQVMNSDTKLYLPASCCYVSKAKECSLRAVTATCTGDSLEYIKAEMKAFQGEAFDLACGSNYDHKSAKCVEILNQLRKLDPKTKLPKSILPVTLKIMSEFVS